MILGPICHFPFYFYTGYKIIKVYEKNKVGPMQSLKAKFQCGCFCCCCKARMAVTLSHWPYASAKSIMGKTQQQQQQQQQ